MIDYFALLQQPRRPWLDAEALKQTYQRLTLELHPDRPAARENGLDFSAVNEGYRILSNPKQRLRHLLALEGHDARAGQSIPNELIELFEKTGPLAQGIDGMLAKLASANSALSKSLLRSQLLNAQRQADELLDQLRSLHDNALEELKQLDAVWDVRAEQMLDQLEKIYHRLAYLGRWMDQIRERQFQLSV
jgi:curved DNA-binding protein CbpA